MCGEKPATVKKIESRGKKPVSVKKVILQGLPLGEGAWFWEEKRSFVLKGKKLGSGEKALVVKERKPAIGEKKKTNLCEEDAPGKKVGLRKAKIVASKASRMQAPLRVSLEDELIHWECKNGCFRKKSRLFENRTPL